MTGWPGTRKTTSSAINDKTVSTSPALVAAIQVETSPRISCSSFCMCAPLVMTLNVLRERPCRSPMVSQLWVIGFSPFSRQHFTLPRHRRALQPLLAPVKLLRLHSASELDELSIIIEKSHDFGC